MPKYQKLTSASLPQHLDNSAEDHNGHGWETFNTMVTSAKVLSIRLRVADVVSVFGVDRKTAKSWLEIVNGKEEL